MSRNSKEPTSNSPEANAPECYVLRLYVSGATPRSAAAIANLREICETYLNGRFDLQVIDIYQQPELARDPEIIATPTLIKKLPLRRLVGDLSKENRVLVGLDLLPKPL